MRWLLLMDFARNLETYRTMILIGTLTVGSWMIGSSLRLMAAQHMAMGLVAAILSLALSAIPRPTLNRDVVLGSTGLCVFTAWALSLSTPPAVSMAASCLLAIGILVLFGRVRGPEEVET